MKPFNLLRKKRSISWILFFSLIHCLSSEGGKIDEVPVTLIGTVAIVQYYGPPNYGETPEIDSIEKHPVLTSPIRYNNRRKRIMYTFDSNYPQSKTNAVSVYRRPELCNRRKNISCSDRTSSYGSRIICRKHKGVI